MSTPLTAIISDLHANWPALEAALADASARGARRIVCLGDVIGYGADPRRCLDRIMELCGPESDSRQGLLPGLCLLGNHEHALLNSAEDFNASARAAIDWTRDQLNGGEDRARNYAYWEFLDTLRPQAVEDGVMYAHGSPRDPVREYVLPMHSRDPEKMAALFSCLDARICFIGHSHVPAVYFESGRLFRPRDAEGSCDLGEERAIVNVGSVGQPRDGDPRLSYALFDGRQVTFVRRAYDVSRSQADIRAVPELPDYLADRLGHGR